jgi:isopenicillin N synthase-like dioxygenase
MLANQRITQTARRGPRMSATAEAIPPLAAPALARWARPNEVPAIDFAPLATKSASAIDAVAKQVDDACREIGFFTVLNHPVPVAKIRRIFAESARFFSQKLEEKLKLHMRNSTNFRGYLPMDETAEASNARGRAVFGFQEHMEPGQAKPRKPNKTEVFQISLDLAANDPDVLANKPLHGVNPWPDNLPGFREGVLDYFDSMRDFAALMASLFARGLGLQHDFFVPFYTKPLIQLRLLHYLPQDQLKALEGGDSRQHSDAGGFTMLQQDDVGGLEIRSKTGEWIVVPPVENSFVVNVGDSMKMWTNHRYASTLHRVVNCYGRDRYSVGVFANPNYDTVIAPLPSCIDAEHPPKFEQMHIGEALLFLYSRTWPSRGNTEVSSSY